MTGRNLVTTVIATYNRAEIVSRAIESVLAQTYRNIEVVVVDDGSKDNTQEVLRQYGSRVRVVCQENTGPAAARNRGIALAQGEMIAFLDSDDAWLPEKIERQTKLLHSVNQSVPCCICNATIRAANAQDHTSFQSALLDPAIEEGFWVNAAHVLTSRYVLFNQAVLIRRAALESAGGFDESLRYLEDYDLALRLSLLGPWTFIREPLLIYHKGTAGSLAEESLQKASRLAEYNVQIRDRVLESVKDSSAELAREMRAGLVVARRQLKIARVGEARTWGAATAYRVARYVERYRGALARRSPWFPRMKTSPLPEFTKSPDRESQSACSVPVGVSLGSDAKRA